MASITSSAPLAPSVSSAPRTTGWGRYALIGLATIVAAVLANVAVYYLGAALVGYNSGFIVLSDPFGAILFTVVPAIVAVLLYAALLRFTRHPARNFSIIAAVVFVVTVIPDFTYIPSVPGATNGQTAILVLMHIVAAAVIVGLLTTRTRTESR